MKQSMYFYFCILKSYDYAEQLGNSVKLDIIFIMNSIILFIINQNLNLNIHQSNKICYRVSDLVNLCEYYPYTYV